MRTLIVIFHIGILVARAAAQLPAPVKAHAEKFDAERAALGAAAEAQLKPARERYLAALAAAQKTAMNAAKTGDIAAIAAEIEGVGAGTLAAAFPPDLPRSLSQERRSFLAVSTNAGRTLPQQQRDLAARYLQTLAGLESVALKGKDAAVADAVALERARVVALMEVAGGGQKFHNVVANSDFSQGVPGSFPPGWKAEAGDVQVTDAAVVAEGAERFLRFRRLQALRRANLLPEKEIVIPARTRAVEFSVKLRVKGLVPGRDYHHYPGVHVTARDARGEEAGGDWAVVKQDAAWKRIAVGPFGSAGVLDVDDITVKFQ